MDFSNINEFMVDNFVGLVVDNITIEHPDSEPDDKITFTTADKKIKMYHKQSCCESVTLYSTENLNCLLGTKILKAEEVVNNNSYSLYKEKGLEKGNNFHFSFVCKGC
jgi:hypothetical protein